jgi:hypothetical protein
MRAGILLLVVLSAPLVASCGEQASRPARNSTPPAWTAYQSAKWGFEVRFPRSWRRATEPVTPKLTEPREVLSVGTFPLRYRPTNCEAFAGSVRGDLGPRDAFLTVQERGYDEASEWLDFPPRPERFRPAQDNAKDPEPGCGDRPGSDVRWFNFTDAGRHFHVLVVLGSDAASPVGAGAWRILNTLRFDPNVKPDWPASG